MDDRERKRLDAIARFDTDLEIARENHSTNLLRIRRRELGMIGLALGALLLSALLPWVVLWLR